MNLVVTEDTFAHFGFDSKKTESKIFLIDAKLRLTSKASKIGLGCNAWWEGFSKSSWSVEVVTVVLRSDVFFDPLHLIFFGTNKEKLHRPLLSFPSLNLFSWTAGNIRKGGVQLLSAILWNAATWTCMCHEVYQKLNQQLSKSDRITINTLHPNISIHILHTVLNTFPEVLTRRICLTI